jgi:para-nitrobenzyl esterase
MFLLACSDSSQPGPGPLDVTTDKGVVEGTSDGTVRQFLGIPFAAPPVGSLRFMPPTPAAAWTTPFAATHYGPSCPQLDGNGNLATGSSEDCLYLNVWAPLADVKNAPVFVWIYGGGFIVGSASDPLSNGENFVANTGAVVVALNYRLGPFGFLSHPAFAAAEGVTTSPSQGLLDQQAALKWVQTNIAAFGGDPANVTIVGESAGGVSVCTQLAMPGSNGLFAHAIIESGLCASVPALFQPPAQAEDQGNRTAAALGCTDAATLLSCMQGKTTEEVITALPLRHALFGPTGENYAPVIDGAALPLAPGAAFKAGTFAKVPTVVGSNLNEGQLFLALWGSPPPTSTDVRTALGVLVDAAAVDTIAAKYGVDTDAPTAFVNILGDAINCMARSAARAISAGGAPTYLYHFVYPFELAVYPGVVTTHAYELPFVFQNPAFGQQLSDADVAVSDIVQGYWSSFMTTGIPAGPVAWPAYDQAGDQDLEIDTTPSVATGLKSATCDFWDTYLPE